MMTDTAVLLLSAVVAHWYRIIRTCVSEIRELSYGKPVARHPTRGNEVLRLYLLLLLLHAIACLHQLLNFTDTCV